MFRAAIVVFWLGFAAVAQAAPALADYVKEPAIDNVQLSPSGERYAYTFTEGGVRRLYVATPGGPPPVVVDTGTADVTKIDWAGEDHLLVYVSAIVKLGPPYTADKAWLASVLVFNLKTRNLLRVFDHKDPKVASQVGDFVEGSFGTRLIDGHWYGYFAGLSHTRSLTTPTPGSLRDLFQVDLDTGATKVVSIGSDQSDDWVVGPTGDVPARFQYDWISGDWRVLAGPSGKKVLASGRSPFERGGDLKLGRNANEILFEWPAEDEYAAVYKTLPLSGATPSEVADSDSVERMVFDRTSGFWIGTIYDGDRPRPELFAPGLQEKILKVFAAFPSQPPQLVSWSEDFNRAVVLVSGTAESGAYYLVDLSTNKAESIGFQYPDIDTTDVGAIRTIDYRASDGLALHGVLSLPAGAEAKNLPLVMLPHGSVGTRSYPTFNAIAQAFASRGYAVFQPNSRGSTGYGREFVSAGFGQLGRRMQTDISDAVAELARQGIVDPKRVCIAGSDWGGYAAQAGVTLQKGIYRCAVSMSGYSDLSEVISYYKTGTGVENGESRVFRALAVPRSNPQFDIRSISPLKQAGLADAPILLVYNKDGVGPTSKQSEAMASALRGSNKYVEQVAITGAGDEATEAASRIAMLTAAVAFVEKFNPTGATAPAAATTANASSN